MKVTNILNSVLLTLLTAAAFGISRWSARALVGDTPTATA